MTNRLPPSQRPHRQPVQTISVPRGDADLVFTHDSTLRLAAEAVVLLNHGKTFARVTTTQIHGEGHACETLTAHDLAGKGEAAGLPLMVENMVGACAIALLHRNRVGHDPGYDVARRIANAVIFGMTGTSIEIEGDEALGHELAERHGNLCTNAQETAGRFVMEYRGAITTVARELEQRRELTAADVLAVIATNPPEPMP